MDKEVDCWFCIYIEEKSTGEHCDPCLDEWCVSEKSPNWIPLEG